MAQLGLGLGVSNVSSLTRFSPLDLDPYLLFDAQTSMIGTLENPTLDLDPATPSTLDVITATRAGVATYTDASGLIQAASPNTVRVDQTQGAELTPTKYQNIGYTDFSQSWSQQNTTITTGATTAPDGTETAIKITEASASSSTYDIRHTISGGNNTFTNSIYAKQADANRHLYLEIGYTRVGVNLETGAVFYSANNFLTGWSNASVSVVSLENGWYRISLTATASSSVTSFKSKIHVATLNGAAGGIVYNGDGTSGIFIWGPQLEEGTTASDFVANTTGSPKFITGATYGPRVPMILVEPSATNLFEYSEDFTQWSLSKEGTGEFPVVTSDYADGPLGGLADRIQFSTGGGTSGSDGADVRLSPTVANGTAYTYSVWLKSLSGSVDVKLLAQSCSPNSYTATVTPEWQKFTYPLTGGFNGLRIVRVAIKGNDTTTADVLVWGAQLETGTVATSYIPTSGSTVTRAADDLVIDGSDFSNFFNSGGDGTFFVTAQIKNPAENHSLLRGGSNFQLYVYSNDGSGQHYTYDGGTASSYGGVVENQLTNFAISYGASTYTISRDGTNPSPQAGSGNLSSATKLEIGKGYSNLLNGHIKRVIYWPLHSDNL